MTATLDNIQKHTQRLRRREQIDKYLEREEVMEYKNKALRFKEEIDREEFLTWLLHHITE